MNTLAAILRGDPTAAPPSEPMDVIEACRAEGLTNLLSLHISQVQALAGWPRRVVDDLARAARAMDAYELLRGREIASVLKSLGEAGLGPILLKGTALAYSVYPTPASRPRADCDVLIRRDDTPAIHRVMATLGYTAPLQCDGEHLFRQFPLTKTDRFGVDHQFDFHWKISSQSLFADLLTYDEASREAMPVETLGPHARTLGLVHALLLACVHPVMHHRNMERLIWVYDLHLLASRLSDDELNRFADLATGKHVAAIAANQLALSQLRFATRVPDRVIARLAGPAAEPSASYLRPGRRWHHELASNVKALPSWRDRWTLLREVFIPSPRYMLETYGIKPGPLGRIFVPALYLHRGTWGLVKILRGRK